MLLNTTEITLLSLFALLAIGMFLRYCSIAGLVFGICRFFKEKLKHRKIQTPFTPFKRIGAEIFWSLCTAAIFAAVIVTIVVARQNGYTMLYSDIAEYGYLYFIFSIFALFVIHDAYFYWSHWLLHNKHLFRKVHFIHHLSFNPTPWTAAAFHPVEGFLQVAFLIPLVFIMPLHPLAILIFSLGALLYNVYGHNEYEWFKFKKVHLLTTATSHNMHHSHSNCNYGLYFTYWDKWMGTWKEPPSIEDRKAPENKVTGDIHEKDESDEKKP